MKATEQLKHEHKAVMLMLKILDSISKKLEKNEKVSPQHLEAIIDFLKTFVDKCHHGKEEKLLFPLLEAKGIPNKGGPIGVMLAEHILGREFVKKISEAVSNYSNNESIAKNIIIENINGYINLLTHHIEKENNMLFALTDNKLSPDEQSKLYMEFENLEENEIGKGKHEEFHNFLKELSSIYDHS